jgi:hypothetical protein
MVPLLADAQSLPTGLPSESVWGDLARQWPVLVLFILAVLGVLRFALSYLKGREERHAADMKAREEAHEAVVLKIIDRHDVRLAKFDQHLEKLQETNAEAIRTLGRLDSTMTLNTDALRARSEESRETRRVQERTQTVLLNVEQVLREHAKG